MYKIYLGKIRVPTPGKLEIKVKGANKVIRLANDGEMNLIRQPGLTEFKFKMQIPMIGAEKSPDFYLKYLEGLMTSGKPFQFIVNRTDGNTKEFFNENLKLIGNTAVTLESFDVVEDANNGSDVEVSVVLKRYVHYVTKEVALQIDDGKRVLITAAAFRSRPQEERSVPAIITAASGDTKTNLERKFRRKAKKLNRNRLNQGDKLEFTGESGGKGSGAGGSFSPGNVIYGKSGGSGSGAGGKLPEAKKTTLGQAMKKLRKSGRYRGSR